MPPGLLKPCCILCKTSSSPMWRKNENNESVCNACFFGTPMQTDSDISSNKTPSAASSTSSNGNEGGECLVTLRKSTRAKSSKAKQPNKGCQVKGRGRRIKKPSNKAPTTIAMPITTDSFFHKGTYFQVGDIVSLVGQDNQVYYAQLKALLQDQYCEKSALLTWLYPTLSSPKERFDPDTYIIGAEEEFPRKIEFMTLVCHAPSDYYVSRNAPYKTISEMGGVDGRGFVWTRVGPRLVPRPTQREVFGIDEDMSTNGDSLTSDS